MKNRIQTQHNGKLPLKNDQIAALESMTGSASLFWLYRKGRLDQFCIPLLLIVSFAFQITLAS